MDEPGRGENAAGTLDEATRGETHAADKPQFEGRMGPDDANDNGGTD